MGKYGQSYGQISTTHNFVKLFVCQLIVETYRATRIWDVASLWATHANEHETIPVQVRGSLVLSLRSGLFRLHRLPNQPDLCDCVLGVAWSATWHLPYRVRGQSARFERLRQLRWLSLRNTGGHLGHHRGHDVLGHRESDGRLGKVGKDLCGIHSALHPCGPNPCFISSNCYYYWFIRDICHGASIELIEQKSYLSQKFFTANTRIIFTDYAKWSCVIIFNIGTHSDLNSVIVFNAGWLWTLNL